MADIELVIKIPEEEYKCVQLTGHIGNTTAVSNALLNGTPLPEHHGDLVDRNELLKQYGLENATKYDNKDAEQQKHSYSTMMMYEIADMIEDAETVIPATRQQSSKQRRRVNERIRRPQRDRKLLRKGKEADQRKA